LYSYSFITALVISQQLEYYITTLHIIVLLYYIILYFHYITLL